MPRLVCRLAVVLVLLACAPAALAQAIPLTASDGLAAPTASPEAHVRLSWTATGTAGELYQIRRARLTGGVPGTYQVLVVRPETVTSYEDTSALPGVAYRYVLDALTSGRSGTADGSRVLRRPETAAATDSARVDGVRLTWTDLSAVELGYVVFRSATGAPPTVAAMTALDTVGVDATSYLDTTADVLQPYQYCVGLLDGSGGAPAVAEPLSCDTGTRGAVLPPAGVAASDGSFAGLVRVVWTPAPGITYAVSRKAVGQPREPLTSGLTDGTYDDATGTPDLVYRYCVTAQNAVGVSVAACDDGRRGALAPPRAVAASDTTSDSTVELTWLDDTPTETGFRITRTPLAGGTAELVTTTAADRTRYTDVSALPDVPYTYCVQAVASATVGGTTVVNASVPVCDPGERSGLLAPIDFTATDGTPTNDEAAVVLAWESLSTAVQLFQVLRDGVPVATLAPFARGYRDETGLSGTTYSYRLRAVTVLTDNPAGVTQGLAPLFTRASAERAALTSERARARDRSADPAADLARLDGRAADVETALVRDVQALLAGLGIDARALTDARAASAGLRDAYSAPDAGTRRLRAPTGPTATTDLEDRVRVTWTDRSAIETLYEIRAHYSPTDSVTVRVLPNQTQWTDLAASAGSDVRYRVRARDRDTTVVSVSAWAEVTGRRVLLPPGRVTARQLLREMELTVTWRDSSRAETGYVVTADLAAGVQTFDLPAGARQAIVPIQPDDFGRATALTVRAVSGGRPGLPSQSAAGTVTPTPTLLAPRVVTASTDYASQIVVSWTDDSAANTGYTVTRDGTPVGTLGADVTTYVDSAPTGQATYCVVPTGAAGTAAQPAPVCATGRTNTSVAPSTGDVVTTVLASDESANAAFGSTLSASDGQLVVGGPGYAQDLRRGVVADWAVPFTPSSVYFGGYLAEGVVAGGIGTASFYARTEDGWSRGERFQIAPGDLFTYRSFGADVDVQGNVAVIGAPAPGRYVSHPQWVLGQFPVGTRTFQTEATISDGGAYIYTRANEEGAWSRVQLLRAVNRPSQSWQSVTNPPDFGQVNEPGITNRIARRYRWDQGGFATFAVLEEEEVTDRTDFIRRTGELVALNGDWAFASYADDSRSGYFVGTYQASANWAYVTDVPTPTGFNTEAGGSSLAATEGALAIGSGAGNQVFVYPVSQAAVTATPFVINSPVGSGEFGYAVAILGDRLVVGAPDADRVYVYRKSATGFAWTNPITLTPEAGDTRFGTSLSITDDFITIGAETAGAPGVVYTFRPDGVGYVQAARLTPDASAGTTESVRFGAAVAASGDDVLIGAPGGSGIRPNEGQVFVATLGITPSDVQASDGRYANRVQIRWGDETDAEDGYRIYRRGPTDTNYQLVGSIGANLEVFDDFDVEPGDAYAYCVASFIGDDPTNTTPSSESGRACDVGYTPPNGTISGRLATGEGAGVIGSDVCLAPGPDQAVNFDGIAGRASVPDFGAMPTAFTVEAWYDSDDDPDRFSSAIVSIGGETRFTLRRGNNTVGGHSIAQVELVYGPIGAGAFAQVGSQSLSPGWHHVAATYDGNRLAFFVDGQLAGSTQSPVQLSSPLTGAFHIGHAGSGLSFDGRLDDIRVWSRALTTEDIAAEYDARRPLRGDEVDLYAYWAVDQGRGRILTDLTAGGRHATLEGGAEWTPEAAPLNACATSDGNGNYAFNGLRYGTSASFNITPTDSTRQFTPGTRTATLTPASPTQNQVDFTDTSAYTVRGTVAHAFDAVRWPGQADVPAEGVQILVDGTAAGTSASDGTFAVAVRGAGAHVVTAQADHHVFTATLAAQSFPDGQAALTLLGDVDGLRFTNVRQDTLRGQAGGGCGLPVGNLTFRLYTEDRRFDQTVTTDGSRPYALPLPPLAYRLEYQDITNVQAPLTRAAVVQYFRNLGVLDADLTAGADTVDFRYRAPIALAVTGLGEPEVACDGGYRVVDAGGVERQLLPNVPVLAEYARPLLTVRAFEDYGDGGRCPVDAGTVRIFDGFADATNEPVEVELTDGQATYRTFGRSPDTFSGRTVGGVDRSYQKSLTAVLEVPDGPTVTETVWAYVEGYREKPATFVTATSSEIPILILRDPPGSESSAFVEEGTTSCTSISSINVFDGAAGAYLDFRLGLKSAIGVFVTITAGGAFNLQTTTLIGGGVTQTNGPPESNMQVCATTTERWETSGDTGWSGEDLYAGVGVNFIFAEADQLDAESDGGSCRIRLSTTLAADFNAPDPFETDFVYGTTHIENTLIPLIERRIRLAGTPAPGNPPSGPAPESVVLQESLANWRGMIAYDSTLVTRALGGTVENRSFSGGTSYSFGVTADTTYSASREQRVAFSTDTRFGGVFTAGGYDNYGLAVVQLATEQTFGISTETTNTFGTGYTLADGDAGDFFTVDVARDSTYGTFVFNTLSGASSNPWEPGTQQRDRPLVSVDPPVRTGIPNGTTAQFTLSLTNASDSNERREYTLDAPPHLNPRGAVIRLGGLVLNERRVLVDAGQTISFPVTVERGPEDDEYDLAIIAYSPFDHAIWRTAPQLGLVTADTARFHVSFRPTVAPLVLVEPEDGWVVSIARDTLQLTLDQLVLQGTARERVGVELRRPGQAWADALSLLGSDLAGATTVDSVWTPDPSFADGAYELRAFAVRTEPDGTAAPAYRGPVVTGRIDRTAPLLFGLPEPADQVLALGETVGVTFDEIVDCARLSADLGSGAAAAQISPDAGAGPVLTVNCAERTVLFGPADASTWTALEGQLVTARLRGVRDLVGNPMAPVAGAEPTWDASWRFTVRRNAFGWTPSIVAASVPRNVPADVPAALVNGRAQPVDYSLELHSPTGLPFSFVPIDPATGTPTGGPSVGVTASAPAGTVVSGDVQPVAFRWPGAPDGTYRATVQVSSTEAGTALGQSPLTMTVTVACQAPAWAVNAAAFETYMPVVAELRLGGAPAASEDPADVLAAFVGGQVRGVGSPAPYTSGGATAWRVPLNVYGSGAAEQITFQAWDQSACALHATSGTVVAFANTSTPQWSVQNPLLVEAPGAGGAPLEVPLAQGWTWVSTNRTGTNTFSTALVGVGTTETDLIQGADGFALFTPGVGWEGSITGMTPGDGYHIRLAAPATMVHPGPPVDPTTPVGLLAGWNWIGYLPAGPLAVDDALAGLAPAPATDDMIKSQTQYAQFVEGVGWWGPLETMAPGAGYQLFVAEDGVLTYPGAPRPGLDRWAPFAVRRYDTLPVQMAPGAVLAFGSEESGGEASGRGMAAPSQRGARAPASATATSASRSTGSARTTGARTDPQVALYEHSMTVTAALDGAPEGTHVAAYAVTPEGDDLRAVAPVQQIDALGGTRAFLLVPGMASDSLALRAVTPDGDGGWTPAGDLTLAGTATPAAFRFVRDRVTGTAATPVALAMPGTVSAGDAPLPAELALSRVRPNPFSASATVAFALPAPADVRLSVFDVLGREVAVLTTGERPAGVHAVRLDARHLAAGTYVVRLVAGPEVRIQRVTVFR